MSNKVLCSWSGEQSRELANEFIRIFRIMIDGLEFWISSKEIEPGKRNMETLFGQLKDTTFSIVFITPENLREPWIHFESGAIGTKLGDAAVCPFLFGVEMDQINKTPLGNFQAEKFNREGTLKLYKHLKKLHNKNPDAPNSEEQANTFFRSFWDEIEKNLNEIMLKYKFLTQMTDVRDKFSKEIIRLGKDFEKENEYIKILSQHYFDDFLYNLKNRTNSDYAELLLFNSIYPFALTNILKRKPGTLTKAISIVDSDEIFWPEKTGDLILERTTPNSIRVFAFNDNRQLMFHAPMLKSHARKYNVLVISNLNLSRLFGKSPYDFAIIGDISTSFLLAKYDYEKSTYKKISFSTSPEDISKYNDLLALIAEKAIKIEHDAKFDSNFCDSVFEDTTMPSSAHIEMSEYIPLPVYHEHEEKHAYYIEMMEKMLDIFNTNRKGNDRPTTVLEIGPGTGIFTKRLLKCGNMSYSGVDLDWECYKFLLTEMGKITGKHVNIDHKTKKLTSTFEIASLNCNVAYYNEDARRFNPPGKFDFIFSSFADHHIKIQDKSMYFQNIKRNLNPGGFFIVGDEFLPDYDETDPISRASALNIYHNHIIETTKKIHGDNEAKEFVPLEEAALLSGLQGLGDFKIPLSSYKTILNSVNLKIAEEYLMGPKDLTTVGGIYVLAMYSDGDLTKSPKTKQITHPM